MQWTDPRLSWNPNDYNGTNEITLPVNKIWVPDIVIQVNNFNLFMKNYFFDSTWARINSKLAAIAKVQWESKLKAKKFLFTKLDFYFQSQNLSY